MLESIITHTAQVSHVLVYQSFINHGKLFTLNMLSLWSPAETASLVLFRQEET